tara:strand:- start:510 stop:701 length:192 start_codon:yes stop_codon:yes gene_type:complete
MSNSAVVKTSVVIEDLLENTFITLALAYFIDNEIPTIRKTSIIVLVTLFYWYVIYKYLRPIYS